jgi:excisionase family DNA binding protein
MEAASNNTAVARLTYTPEEAFAALGVGRTLGYRKLREGVIPALHLGGRWIVPKAALERMLEGWVSPSASASQQESRVVSEHETPPPTEARAMRTEVRG